MKSKQRVVVTGGAGFIGSHLVDLLLAKGHHVTVIDSLCNNQINHLQHLKKKDRFRFFQADIRNTAALIPLFTNANWAFHLAALSSVISSVDHPRPCFETNVDGTYNVLEASLHAGVQRLIYAASSSCYQTQAARPITETDPIYPTSPYALTKYLGEQLVLHWGQMHQIPTVSLRLFNVYGPRLRKAASESSVIGIFWTQKQNSQPLTIVGEGDQTRDFVHVTDVARAFYAAANSHLSHDILNVGSGQSHTINALAKLVQGPIQHLPKRASEVHHSLANIEKIKQKLAWSPTISLEEGIGQLFGTIDLHQSTQDHLLRPHFLPTL